MRLPTGTVTFLFTDIEGSTKLWEHNPKAMRDALARHDALMHQSIAAHNGVVFKTMGDAFCAVFATAPLALDAALTAQQALHRESWPDALSVRVRMALHTGATDERDGDYFGQPLNRVARLLSAGNGGQTLLSLPTYELTRDALPPNCTLQDLGAHSLRDLARPEQVFQLCHPDLPTDFLPLKSLDNPDLPNNLPLQLTSFVGREKELAQAQDLLAKTRLFTLTGSGGCGKTRLALQTAADVLDLFPDGVWLVELAPITNPDLVPQTLAGVLGVKEQVGKTNTQALTEYLKAKTLLLVLDNCEHVLSAAAQLTDTLLRSCPNVKVLASSREALSVAGEQTYRVPSLTLPDSKAAQTPESLSQYEAVRLFIERAMLVKSDFAVTNQNAPALASVCQRLDGIPLAIELAAARVRSLSVEEINARLDNRFRLLTGGSKTALPRQQTLQALIDWSYGLLTQEEKALLVRLSVFAGGWTLPAAETVCSGDTVEDWGVLDLLTSLVDKSLVIAEAQTKTTRYQFLETVRQYARDRLAEGDKSVEVRGRHRDYFVQIALEAKPKLVGGEQGQWLSTLETEHDNLRQAITFCLEQGAEADGAEKGLRLGAALLRFWQIRGHAREGWERLTALLSHPEAQAHTKARADALNSAGILADMQNDYGAARSLYEESLILWHELDDQSGIADFHMNMGNLASSHGDYASARSHLEQSLALKKEIGDTLGIAGSLMNLGNLACLQGDYALARSRYEESIAIQTELGNRMATANTFQNLGRVAQLQGDLDAAFALYEKSLEIRREFGDRTGIAGGLNSLGNVALFQGDYGAAQSLYVESVTIYREIGDRNGIAAVLGNLGALAYHQGDYNASQSHFAESLAIYRELGKKVEIASTLNNLGNLALDLGDSRTAQSLYEESLVLAQELESRHGTADCLNNLGMVAYYQGDLDASRSLFTDSLTIKREMGDGPGIANSLISLGNVAIDQRDYVFARSLHQESLALSRTMKDRKKIAYSLEGFAALAVPQGSGERAARLFGAAAALREAIGSPLPTVERAWCDRQIEAARAMLSDKAFAAAWAAGQVLTWKEAALYALGE